MSVANHQTKVRNMSGSTRFFGYLNAHGITLDDGEEYTQNGDLLATLSAARYKRKRDSYLADLAAGDLVLVQSPSPHYFDATLDVTKVLQVDNNTVSATDPSVGAYSSSI